MNDIIRKVQTEDDNLRRQIERAEHNYRSNTTNMVYSTNHTKDSETDNRSTIQVNQFNTEEIDATPLRINMQSNNFNEPTPAYSSQVSENYS